MPEDIWGIDVTLAADKPASEQAENQRASTTDRLEVWPHAQTLRVEPERHRQPAV